MIRWEDCRIEFVRDGGLRDIVIPEASREDWQAAYDFIRQLDGATYTYDGEQRNAPLSVDDIFGNGEGHRSMLSVAPSGLPINLFFHMDDEIEAVFNPESVWSQESLDALLHFLKQLGDAVGKPVTVYPAGCREGAMFTYDPASKTIIYHAPRFGELFSGSEFRQPFKGFAHGFFKRFRSWLLHSVRRK